MKQKQRLMEWWAGAMAVILCAACLASRAETSGPLGKKPNVIVILTDDQGYGDLGFHGNPHIRTPNLDRLARESARCTNFYVSPVCSPTRASLMTGRYNYRTGVVDTYLGRAMMHPEEVTLAQMFAAAGYRTGIFGKWHLGDNYPLRPMDRGFQECLVHKGGGIGQPSDPPGGESYFDPILQHNGKAEKVAGYCSDIYTDAALAFVEKQREKPFFAWLAFNAPHEPLQVPASYLEPYQKMDLSNRQFPSLGHPLPSEAPKDKTARVYAMVSNIDDNVGRLLAKLQELKIQEETIVVFMTDNGPQQVRYNAGLLQRKGSVHEGGIRVPFFIRWTGHLTAGREIAQIAAHIDVAPTLLEACGIAQPVKVKFDGVSLWPLLTGQKVDWPERAIYFQWHRGAEPEMHRAFAARTQQYKLVQPLGVQNPLEDAPRYLLFDMVKDPLEMDNLANEKPELVANLLKGYEQWFQEVGSTHGFTPPLIYLGAEQENPTTLTRQDWRGASAGWAANSVGYWEVRVARAGLYRITLYTSPMAVDGTAHFTLRETVEKKAIKAGVTQYAFENVALSRGIGRLEGWFMEKDAIRGPKYVEVEWLREH